MKRPPIRIVDLAGSAEEMGATHGRLYRDEIRKYADDRIDLAVSGLWTGGALSRADVLDVAELLLGFVGIASGANDNDYTLAFGSKGGVLLCVEPDTSLDDFFGDKADKMTLWTVRQGLIMSQGAQIGQNEGYRIDLETWVKLLDLAHKTYVPASEASRLSGAGAGLVDND